MKKLLPEVCTIQYGFPFDSAKFSDSNGMPLIRIRDVVRGYSETYTTEEYKSEYIVHENDYSSVWMVSSTLQSGEKHPHF